MGRAGAWYWYRIGMVGADAILLGLAFVLAAVLRDAMEFVPFQPEFDPLRYGLIAAGLIPGLLGLLWMRDAYAHRNLFDGPDEYGRVASGCTYGTVLVIAASYFTGSGPLVSRGWLLLFWGLSIGLVSAGRFTLRRVAYGLRPRGWFHRRVLIVGANDQGLAIAQQLHGETRRGIDVVGFLDDFLPLGTTMTTGRADWGGASLGGLRVIGHPRDAETIAARHGCDLLIIVPSALSWESQRRFVQLGDTSEHRLEMRLAPTQYDVTAVGVEPAPLGYIPLVRLRPARITGVDAVLRATIDAGLAALLLVLAAPALAWVVGRARLRGIRPSLVHREVLGQGGRIITLSLLNRRVSDRLLLRGVPALLAVLRGQLALVGPRPVAVEARPRYRDWADLLLTVKPGLTGPWRLGNSAESAGGAVLADAWWVRNWTVWQHLSVLLQSAARTARSERGRGLTRWEGDSSALPVATWPALAMTDEPPAPTGERLGLPARAESPVGSRS